MIFTCVIFFVYVIIFFHLCFTTHQDYFTHFGQSQSKIDLLVNLQAQASFLTWSLSGLNWYGPPHEKTNKMTVCPANTQISLGIRPVWSESSLCAQWVVKDPSFLHAVSEDSDHTGRMPRLIWVFAGRTCHFVGFVMRRLIWLYSDERTRGTTKHSAIGSTMCTFAWTCTWKCVKMLCKYLNNLYYVYKQYNYI